MADYTNWVTDFIKASSDVELANQLTMLNLRNKSRTDIITIKKIGRFWYAWFYTDMKKGPLQRGNPVSDVNFSFKGRSEDGTT